MSKHAPFGDGFDASKYWSRFEHKKWVVTIETGPRRARNVEVLYVRARTQDAALETARRNAEHQRGKFFCRLAHPSDLGCVPVAPQPSPAGAS